MKEQKDGTKNEKKYVKKKMPIKDYIFFLQSRRDYSYKEIYDKLIKREEDPEEIKKALNYMIEEGYQSDERMAENYYKMKKNRKGDRLIHVELRNKGVSEEVINNVIKENSNSEDNIENILALMEKFSRMDLKDRKIKEKAFRRVLSKGFSYSDTQKAWAQLIEKNIDL